MQGSYNNFAYFSADFSASREKLETMITELISLEFFEREHGDVESFIQQEGTDLLRTLLQGYLNIRAANEVRHPGMAPIIHWRRRKALRNHSLSNI